MRPVKASQGVLHGVRRLRAQRGRVCRGLGSGFVALQGRAPHRVGKAVELPGFRRPIAEGVSGPACLRREQEEGVVPR